MPVAIQMPNIRQEESTSSKIARAVQGFANAHESAMDRRFRQQQAERQAKMDEQNLIQRENELQARGDQQIQENAFKARELGLREREASRKAEPDFYKNALMEERLQKMKDERAKAEFAKTPEGRLQGLNSSDKQRLDNAKLGLVSVQGMGDALLRMGQNTFSVIGDNDFTQQRSLFEEALGRMQSGGAISKEEESRFKSMAPTWRDSPEMQKKKLVQLQAEMQNRMGTLGFQSDELGIQPLDLAALKPPGSGAGLSIPAANASESSGLVPIPKAGLVEDGYRFRGGDPKNPKNWERVK